MNGLRRYSAALLSPRPDLSFITGHAPSHFMNVKNVVTGGIAAGFLLLILMMVSGYLVNMVMPG